MNKKKINKSDFTVCTKYNNQECLVIKMNRYNGT